MIYGNARVDPTVGWCATDADTGEFIRDENNQLVPADKNTGRPLTELPPLCSECKRPLPRKR